ncbi:MAG TPA: hypothetical protein VIE67_05190 [Rudaea sp.]|jgi:hypothetical protein|uniref:hypothetical protein n=1 Tax=Rudaea sp. TaxID=2136325 RepID=UPI002F92870A
MRNWLEKYNSLSLGMLFTQGHLLPSEQVPTTPAQEPSRAKQSLSVSVVRRCADACRKIVQRPRLIQPH